MIGKKSLIGILSLATLASCTTQNATTETTPVSITPTPTTVTPTQTGKTIVIHKSYSLGDEDTATLNGSMVVNNDTITSITIDNPKGPIKIFADGVSEKVVGKSLKNLQIDTVSGASLTSAAFNEFLKTVE